MLDMAGYSTHRKNNFDQFITRVYYRAVIINESSKTDHPDIKKCHH